MNSIRLLSVLSAFSVLVALEAMALVQTGGYFEYPLDDVYIHLAIAETIWAGGYGVNIQEYAAAASSPLYPVLLLPVAGLELQRFMPLVWNIIGLGLSAWLWAELLLAGGYGAGKMRRFGWALAVLGPAAVLMPSTAFLGMEHTLHTAASLAILLGLVRLLQGNPSWGLLYAGILFSPLLRFEGLALALLATLVIYTCNERRRAAQAFALAILPIAAFCSFLVSLGLDPLPSSVQAKLVGPTEGQIHGLERIIFTFLTNVMTWGGAVLALFLGVLLIMRLLSGRLRNVPMQKLWAVLIGATMAHLMFGQIGWMDRYEHYILAVLAAGLLILLPQTVDRKAGIMAVVVLLIPLVVYARQIVVGFPISARSIFLQQRQMSIFAKTYMQAPVAVNDLGWVAWGNPDYVLDIYGLGSVEALKLRISGAKQGWAGPLAERHNVPFAMIYDEWMARAVGDDWVRIGTFALNEDRGFISSDKVAFYATSPAHVPQVLSALHEWVPTLHPQTHFIYEAGQQ
ncbi:hypothetical protein [Profundibacter sp.]